MVSECGSSLLTDTLLLHGLIIVEVGFEVRIAHLLVQRASLPLVLDVDHASMLAAGRQRSSLRLDLVQLQ